MSPLKLKVLCVTVGLIAAADGEAASEKRSDLYGDPLPEGAIVRLGTIQRRAIGAQIALSADGKSVVSLRNDVEVSLWDAATGRLQQTRELSVKRQTPSFRTLLSPQGRWLATYSIDRDATLLLWDARSGEKRQTLTVPDSHGFFPVVFAANEKRLAAVSRMGKNQTIRVWDLDSGREIWQKRFDTFGAIWLPGFTPDGKHLLVQFEGTSCWDLDAGRRLWHNKEISPRSLAVTPAGRIIAEDWKKTRMLELATGQPVKVEDGTSPIPSGTILSCSPDGRILLISTDKGPLLWDVGAGKTIRTLAGAGARAVFTPDGKSIITNNGSLQRWDAATGEPLWGDTFERGHIDEVVSIAFSADGTRLASTSVDGSVRLWDARTGKPLRVWHGHESWRDTLRPHWQYENVQAVDLTPDGRWLLSSGSGEDIKLWDASQEKAVRSLKLPPREEGESERLILRLRISPDGAKAIGLFLPRQYPKERPYKLATWDLKTGELRTCHPIKMGQARPFAFSPDGRTCLVGDLLVDSESGAKIVQLENEPGGILPSIFSQDGALVINSFWVSLTKDGKSRTAYGVRAWESATGKKMAWLETAEMHWRLAASADHRLVATLGARWAEASNPMLWDMASGKRMESWKIPGGRAGCIALSLDGRRLATGHSDSTILIWDVPTPERRVEPLSAKELEARWTDLADADAAKAWRAVWRMADAPKEVLPYLRGRLKPCLLAPAEVTRKLLADLDDDSFQGREAAVKRLKELGLQAEPALRAALKAQPSPEQKRRIETVLAALRETPLSSEELRQLRALIVLERIGSPEARHVLTEMAKGLESARLTRQARAALRCLP